MPKINIYTPSSNVPSGVMAQTTSPFTQAGKVVDAYSEYLEKEQKKDAVAYVSKATSEMQLQEIEEFDNLKNTHDNLDTLTQTYKEGFNMRKQAYIDAAPSEDAKMLFSSRADSLSTQFLGNAMQFQTSEKETIRLQGYDDNINRYAATVATNFGLLEQTLSLHATDMQVAKDVQSVGETEKYTRAGRDAIVAGAFDGLMRTSPGRAKQELLSGAYDDVFGAKKAQYLDMADRKIQALSNKQEKQGLIDDLRTGFSRAEREAAGETFMQTVEDDMINRGVNYTLSALDLSASIKGGTADPSKATSNMLNKDLRKMVKNKEDMSIVEVSDFVSNVRGSIATGAINAKDGAGYLMMAQPLINAAINSGSEDDGTWFTNPPEYGTFIRGMESRSVNMIPDSVPDAARKREEMMMVLAPRIISKAKEAGVDLSGELTDKQRFDLGKVSQAAIRDYVRTEVPALSTLNISDSIDGAITADGDVIRTPADSSKPKAIPDVTVNSVLNSKIPEGAIPRGKGRWSYPNDASIYKYVNGKETKVL